MRQILLQQPELLNDDAGGVGIGTHRLVADADIDRLGGRTGGGERHAAEQGKEAASCQHD